MVFGALDRKQNTLNLDMTNHLDLYGYSFVHLRLDLDRFVVFQIFIVLEANIKVLTLDVVIKCG